jgi:phosphatidylinositol dimannoside acyltransferase
MSEKKRLTAPTEPPPHAPEAGLWKRALGPFYITGVFWFRFHCWGARIMREWMLWPVVSIFTTFFWIVLRNIRRAIAGNLEAVLGPCGIFERERRIYRTFITFAWCLTERYQGLATEKRATVEIEGEEIWKKLSANPRGFILLTAHLGAWEVGSFLPGSEIRRRVHVVREGETDPRAQAFVRELIEKRASDGFYTTHFAADDPTLGMKLLDGLREGDLVALQGDRPRAWGKSVPGTLFGRPFPLPAGPAALARAANVPLVPVFVFRVGRLHYLCRVREPIEVPSTNDRDADISAAVANFTTELEAAIRTTPHQWFCFREIWPRKS